MRCLSTLSNATAGKRVSYMDVIAQHSIRLTFEGAADFRGDILLSAQRNGKLGEGLLFRSELQGYGNGMRDRWKQTNTALLTSSASATVWSHLVVSSP